MAINLDHAHANMVAQQVRPNDVLNPQVLVALKTIKRDKFVKEKFIKFAYADMQLPMDFGQFMLSPVQEGRFLEALNIKSNEQILEIGTGSGYFTAILSTLADQVLSVELIPELSHHAQKILAKMGISNIAFEVGDAAYKWELKERIDIIIITAALITIPGDYLQDLKVGGRMLAVVGKPPVMSVQLICRISECKWQTKIVYETLIPAMINAEPAPEFTF